MTREEIEELKGLAASMGLYDDKNPCKRAVVLGKAIKALEQEPCENIGNIYECSCGYGWDKNKVVRHHFCPNCGRKVQEVRNESTD